jgi:hypothetical protein
MTGSDDDFGFGDFDLDADDLAALDAEEAKHYSQAPAPSLPLPIPARAPVVPEPPAPRPQKRQRTAQGWIARPPSQFGDDDLPDISVSGDGSYTVGGGVNSSLSTQQQPEQALPTATPAPPPPSSVTRQAPNLVRRANTPALLGSQATTRYVGPQRPFVPPRWANETNNVAGPSQQVSRNQASNVRFSQTLRPRKSYISLFQV